MTTAAGGLRELHQLLIRLKDVNHKLTNGPKKIEVRKKLVVKKREELAAQKALVIDLKKSADEKDLQLKTNEAKISELQGKLNTVTSNKEYDIFRSQIEADRMANSVLEDEILDSLEKVDQAQQKVNELTEQSESAEAEAKRIADSVAIEEPDLRSELAAIKAAISDAESPLPSSIVPFYRRLVDAHGSDALAAMESGVCTACYMEVSPNNRVELNSGKIVRCRSCDRILYLPE